MIVNRALPLASILLVMGGVLILSWFIWIKNNPGPPLYQYRLITEGGMDRFPDLGLDPQPGISIRKYELRTSENEKPLVILHVGERNNSDNGAVLLDWQNQIGEPLITTAPPISDLPKLTTAVAEHVPAGAVVLGWWDTTRRLDLLTEISTPFRKNLAQPLLVPDAWSGRRENIKNIESDFWGINAANNAGTVDFDNFQKALLEDTATGTARLRNLVGEYEAYLVLHISDIYKLGTMNPEQLGVGYRDFPSGDLHGTIKSIKTWLKEQGYESYAIERYGEMHIRVYFLTDDLSSKTLIAQALPFTSSQPLELEEIKVVYQQGGYWVYRIPAKKT
ncbi:MAG: hydroxylamine oxidation protein HaoB [Gammaproteobacteria bacterium]|nr:hydroxylamine oxidation protein HaoB [Gammaproteobacteria bacterium]